jgi:hypothetical protein
LALAGTREKNFSKWRISLNMGLNWDFTVRIKTIYGKPSFSLSNAQSEMVPEFCDLSSLHDTVCIIKSRMIS